MFLWIALGGAILLLIIWIITMVFQTPWSEWKKDQDTKRREPQKWQSGRDPFTKYRR